MIMMMAYSYEEDVDYMRIHERFPDGFNQWDLRNNNGWSVAFITAFRNRLPKGFDRWEIKESNNETIFEKVLRWKRLPDWLNDWDLVINDDGETCQEIYERYSRG